MNEYCRQNGYSTSDDTLYTEVLTGTIWRERPKLQVLLADARRKKFDVVVIDHTDRIGRGEPIIIVKEE